MTENTSAMPAGDSTTYRKSPEKRQRYTPAHNTMRIIIEVPIQRLLPQVSLLLNLILRIVSS